MGLRPKSQALFRLQYTIYLTGKPGYAQIVGLLGRALGHIPDGDKNRRQDYRYTNGYQ